jgi:hypothetical protein
MLVYESIEDVLKPKSKEEIKKDFVSLDDLQKKEMIFNAGMNKFGGSYTDFLQFLCKVLDISASEFEAIGKRVSDSSWVDEILSTVSDKDLNRIIKKIIPGTGISTGIAESLSDTLKPKTQEEIDNSIQEVIDFKSIRQKIESFSMGHLLCLQVWEPDWETHIYSRDPEAIIKELLTFFMEAYREDYRREIIVYRIKVNEYGTFTDEGRGPGSNGGVSILLQINLTQTYEEVAKVELNIWD